MKSRRSDGFTLFELLVGAAITLLLAGLLLTVTINALDHWQRANSRFSLESQGQLVLDFIERDLNGAFLRTDFAGTRLAIDIRDQSYSALASQGWDSVGIYTKPTSNAASLYLTPIGNAVETAADNRFGVGGAWLRFIGTKDPTSSEIGAPSVISYQLLRKPVSSLAGSDRRYVFYRSTVRVTKSSATSLGAFEIGYDVTDARYNTAGSFQADAGTVFVPNSADALASNVIDFGVWLFTEDTTNTTGLKRLFPISPTTTFYRLTNGVTTPTIAEVMVRIVSDAGMTQLQNIEARRMARPGTFATDDEWWWAVAEANSRVFTRRIPLLARNSP